MARPLRYETPGSLWHVSNRGNERKPIFRDDEDREIFLDLVERSVRKFDWLLSSHTLMTNHYHFTIEIQEKDTLWRGMHLLDGRYPQLFNRKYRRSGHLLQGTYDAQLIEKETYFLNVARYVVLNPVRAGMVQHPADYRWSSYRATAGLDPPPSWLSCGEVLRMMGDKDHAHANYADFVARGADVNPWDDLIGQMFLGSKEWASEIRRKLGDEPLDQEFPLAQRRVGRCSMADIIPVVAAVTRVDIAAVTTGRGGVPRMLAAWLGCYEGLLRSGEIARALGLRRASAVTYLLRRCEEYLRSSAMFRRCLDECVSTLRRT